MANNTQIRFKKQLEKAIIDALTIKSHTLRELEDLTGYNYYTVRTVIKDWEASGLIEQFGLRHKSAIYRMVPLDRLKENDAIPKLRNNQGALVKTTALLQGVGNETNSPSMIAATSLPRTVTRLLMVALRQYASAGTDDQRSTLKSIRAEMKTNLIQLEFLVTIYKSILNNDAFWDPQRFISFPLDPAFDKDEVIEAYRHYYPED